MTYLSTEDSKKLEQLKKMLVEINVIYSLKISVTALEMACDNDCDNCMFKNCYCTDNLVDEMGNVDTVGICDMRNAIIKEIKKLDPEWRDK